MPTAVDILDGNGDLVTVATLDAISALLGEVAASPTSNTVLDRLKSINANFVGTQHIGKVGDTVERVSANFTRPADTTAYASGDLVANSTTAGSVAALSWAAARVAAGSFRIVRAKIKKSNTSTTNASFRLHLYGVDPALSSGIQNGDNGVWSTNDSTYLGSIDITVDKAMRDSANGFGTADIRHKLASGTTVYGLLEARAAYTPASGEVFTVELETVQN